jgi:hypothetical protein
MTDELLRDIPGPAGPLEALVEAPMGRPPRAAAVFAHPHPLYGGTMRSKVVYHGAKALVGIGVAVLRFNFRGVGRSAGTHDGGIGEMDDYRAGISFMATRYPGLPLWAVGYSFGSWVAWNVGLDDERVDLLLGIGVPVNRFDFGPVTRSTKATYMIHGDRDELIPLRDVRRFYSTLAEPKELVVIADADHVFDGRASEVGEAIVDLLSDVGAQAEGPAPQDRKGQEPCKTQ